MRITDVRLEKVRIELVKPFRIAIGVIEDFYTMLVQVYTDEGICGLGEGSPMEIITGETIETTLAAAEEVKRLVMGRDPRSGGAACPDGPGLSPQPSARAAFDLAFTIFAPAARTCPFTSTCRLSAVPSKTMSLWL